MNVVDVDGRTALQRASFFGYSEIVKILKEAGANVNVVDENGRTALHKASFSG